MELIDTHAHLSYEGLAERIDKVLAASIAAGVVGWIAVGTGRQENISVLELTARHDNMWAALGHHPHYANDVTDADIALLEQQARREKVVAIGETGLDYYYLHSTAENQQRIFRAHLDIAAKLQRPVVIHTREAFDDTMSILDDFAGRLKGVVIHCYGGDADQTRQVLERGFYISFTGTITFKRSEALRKVAKTIPPDRVMIETDCPFISPDPVRNIRPNEPALLVHTAQCLADLYGLPLDDFARQTTQTSRTFFGLK
ncbi:MAG: TatD family hydrolase [Planctomycetales bacterium]|nr:TatD family hydrolase [Planctomycetales bacterium]